MGQSNTAIERLLAILGVVATVFSCYVGVLALNRPETREALNPFVPSRVPAVEEIRVTVPVEKVVEVTRLVEATRLVEVIQTVEVTVTRLAPTIALPTYTPYPTYTPVPTVEPSQTPLIPTATPKPSATPRLDTPEGTVLDIGQPWRQGGVEMVLKEEQVTTDPNMGVTFKIYLTNKKPQPITVRHSAEQNYRAVDNRGRTLKIADRYQYYGMQECADATQVINPDQTVFISCNRDNGYGGGTEHIFIPVDIGNNEITEITVTVQNISDIIEARWRIPIYH